jgi:hypothetical protein
MKKTWRALSSPTTFRSPTFFALSKTILSCSAGDFSKNPGPPSAPSFKGGMTLGPRPGAPLSSMKKTVGLTRTTFPDAVLLTYPLL